MSRPRRSPRRAGIWALPIGRYFGIPVRIHWTFFLLILAFAIWIASEMGWSAAGSWAATILLLFACVLLHELSHSVTALLLGYGVKDITLLPIGGIARMEDLVRDPLDELMITAAGPLTNFLLAILLAGSMMMGWGTFHSIPDVTQPYLVSNLFWLNLVIGLFNLLPAFPMDGGRILRSLLALGLGRLPATRIASFLGQMFAVFLILLGLLVNWWLILIGGFVLLAARAEGRAVELDVRMQGVKAGEIAIRNPFVLPWRATMGQAQELAQSTLQQDFPLVDELGRLVGFLDRSVLSTWTPDAGSEVVSDWSVPPIAVPHDEDLADTYAQISSRGAGAAVILDATGRPVGLLPVEQIRKVLVYGWGRTGAAPDASLEGNRDGVRRTPQNA